ncbi:MAG: gamma carbonic anhydrase family protein [Bacteroidetes bacterium]|nr:MAG: gamma carbonic anhydrase family protein [Bacteroidota bacterium]
MPLIKSFKQFHPQIAADVYLAENCTIIGEVEIGAQSSIWYYALLRGDVGLIRIGERTNIQDHAVLHNTGGRSICIVGNDVVVGHRAMLHGCTIGDECLIGMGAIVLDGAVVPKHTLVAAGALIPENVHLESGFLYAGVPARKIKPLTEQQIAMIRLGAAHYVENAKWHREGETISGLPDSGF